MKNKEDFNDAEARIFSAARKVFLKKGMEAATMGDIAAEAGISRTLLNYYFRGKEKLFAGIFENILKNFLPLLKEAVEADLPAVRKLEMVVDIYTDALLKNPDIAIFIASEAARNPERFFAAVDGGGRRKKMFSKFKTAVLRHMKQGQLREMPIEDFATTLFGLVIFPFVGRNIIRGVFFGGADSRFDSFTRRRKKFLKETLVRVLGPQRGAK